MSSSFTAEAMAIIDALGIVDEYSLEAVNICSDSLSTLMALKLGKKKKYKLCPIIDEIKYKLQNLRGIRPNRSIRFIWCPAHVGVWKGMKERMSRPR